MSTVDNDRQEHRTLRREQPVPVDVPLWHEAGWRVVSNAIANNGYPSKSAVDYAKFLDMMFAHLRWAIETHHGGLTDEQVGQLARGLIAGLIDAGIAPKGVEV